MSTVKEILLALAVLAAIIIGGNGAVILLWYAGIGGPY